MLVVEGVARRRFERAKANAGLADRNAIGGDGLDVIHPRKI
jgi:hypothetical protein